MAMHASCAYFGTADMDVSVIMQLVIGRMIQVLMASSRGKGSTVSGGNGQHLHAVDVM